VDFSRACTELQEAVRRNSWEDICEIRDRMQTFAEAFDNDFKEKVEKAEKEIVEQCKTGLQHVLSRWCSDNRIC
jgi:vacuolar-type H+-ATPase subunit H